jgi:hypothetical protein
LVGQLFDPKTIRAKIATGLSRFSELSPNEGVFYRIGWFGLIQSNDKPM